jgi:glutamate formiminotransferase
MADATPPPAEAIEAQRAFDRADAACRRIADALPSSVAVATGEAIVTEEQRAELQEARDARMAALHALLAAKRWEGDGGPRAAEAALREAARDGAPQDAA